MVATLLAVTVSVYVIDKKIECSSGSFLPVIETLIAVHSLQVITLIATIFIVENPKYAYSLCLLCDGLAVFGIYIYIAIATGITEPCEPMMRAWAIADCIVYGCLILSYFGWAIRVKRNYERYRPIFKDIYDKNSKNEIASVLPVTNQGGPSEPSAISKALKVHFMNDLEGRLQRTESIDEFEQASSIRADEVKEETETQKENKNDEESTLIENKEELCDNPTTPFNLMQDFYALTYMSYLIEAN